MDNLISLIQGVLTHKTSSASLAFFLAGFAVPLLVGIFLPRKKTIWYGRIVYKFFGTLMLQKRVQALPANFVSNVVTVFRATFVDIAFGVYIESRIDLTPEEKDAKIKEYLDITYTKEQQEIENNSPQPKITE